MQNMDYIDFFYNRLTELRQQKGVSARVMSLRLGQTEGYINKIENRKSLPSLPVFFYICDYFQITPAEFFGTEENPALLHEILNELRQLSSEQLLHIQQILQDITRAK